MKYLFTFLLGISLAQLSAQTTVYALTSGGSANGGGSIVKINTDGTSFTNLYSFENGGRTPSGEILVASNGNYYGMTTTGGANGLGVLYEYNPTTSTYAIKHNFASATGSKPFGGLVEMSSKYYGMTSEGGSNGVGAIFEYDPATSTYTVRYNLVASTGSHPIGSLTVYNGKLYGVTAEGGSNSGGVIFELNPTGWVYTVKHNFTLATGFAPYSTMAVYNSKLYGLTSEGGANYHGALFEFDPATTTYTLKYSFNFTNGSYPSGSLAVSGTSLYGVATWGGANSAGTLFQYNVSTSTFTLKYSFASALLGTGRRPKGGLLLYNSKLYGSTLAGGTNGVGVLYEYDPTASTYTVKHNFANGTGYLPQSDLAQTGGKLFGTASQGGTHGFGMLYEYNVSGSTMTVKHNFGSSTGENPQGGLVEYNGKYYGVTNLGGTGGGGVIFEFDPTTSAYSVKYNLTAANGKNPHGSLLLLNSKLYGVTAWGGANGLGALFEFDPTASTYTLKYSFGGTVTNGFRPEGSLATLNGHLYGTTFHGGTGASTTNNGPGVLFEYNLTSSTYAVEYNFSTSSGGSSPDGGALLVYNSKLYGLAFHNGSTGDGTLFEFDPATNVYTTKHNFTGTTGGFPFGGLTLYNSNLYGVTGYGGTNNLGALFSYNLSTSAYSNLYGFALANGSVPGCTLVESGGKFYGTTYAGGSNSLGTFFEFILDGNTYSVLRHLAQADGTNPLGEFMISSACTPVTWYADADSDTYGNAASTTSACTAPSGYVANDDDCDDTNAAVNPGATEVCNLIDDDCDGLIDEGVQITFYADADADGYGNPNVTTVGCTAPAGYVANDDDCDDADGHVNPAATEVCNLIDDDCDGLIDEGVQTTFYADADGDSYGNPNVSTAACTAPTGYVTNDDDCDDANAAVNPAATEVCNLIDDDCDGSIDEGVQTTFYADADSDTYGNPASTTLACTVPTGYVSNSTDCNDANSAVNPGATEVCNLIDDDCDTQIDEGVQSTFYADADSDSYGNAASTTLACTAPSGYVANDDDCNDANSAVNPGATETCNLVDDDCDTQIDEGVQTTFYADSDADTYGNAASTTQACTAPSGYVANSTDCNDANSAVNPGATETCNLIDDDCDTQIDEGVQSTFYADSDSDSYGNAASTISACTAPTGYVANDDDCNDANSAIHPGAAEICNSLDDDCSGAAEAASTTWTGNGDALNWMDAANWSDGIVPLACQEVMIPVGMTVNIPAGLEGVGMALEVSVGAVLTVEETGILTIQN